MPYGIFSYICYINNSLWLDYIFESLQQTNKVLFMVDAMDEHIYTPGLPRANLNRIVPNIQSTNCYFIKPDCTLYRFESEDHNEFF